MIFVDTNYFLRYLLNDIPEQHQAAKRLFMAGVDGKVELMTTALVFFEVYWVLCTFYGFNKIDILAALQKVLKFSFIHLRERDILVKALDLFGKTSLDLEDCYNLFYAKAAGVAEFKTFDKKLGREFKNSGL